jgi:hypothetical protein
MSSIHAPCVVRRAQTVVIDNKPYVINTAAQVSHAKDNKDLPFEAFAHFFRPDYRERMTTTK